MKYYDIATDEAYSDGDIENELLQYAESGECDWYEDGRWPIVYHMSQLRHNILNWYPFMHGCSILEIGSGCGALTGLLCERARRVVSVELTRRRAEINYHRHRNYDNLEIVVSDFQNLPADWKFDYVIINGVLEYAAYILKSNEPFADFLKVASNYMEQNGRMLLAIENRLGLKYFAGSKEDHTGNFFSGINNYVAPEKVRTFTKEELHRLISSVQLYPKKYYYPFPDYKFPAEIYTDSTINTMFPTVLDLPLDMSRAELFDEKSVYRSLMEMGVMNKFANSFLVEIMRNPDEQPTDYAYVKLSTNRNEVFRICTYFKEDKQTVYKQALTESASVHLMNMKHDSEFNYGTPRLINVECRNTKRGLVEFPYLAIDSLEHTLGFCYRNGDFAGIIKRLVELKKMLYEGISLQNQQYSLEFENIFGVIMCPNQLRWAERSNIDLIAGNLFELNNQYQVIDYEWHLPCNVPQEFVLWRLLKQLIDDAGMDRLLTKSEYYSIIEINEQTEECFYAWEDHFARKYVGIKDLTQLSQATIAIDINSAVADSLKNSIVHSSLFFDLGNGYSDEHYERCVAQGCNSGFVVEFRQDILSKSAQLRWDPLEGTPCWIKIQRIETDGVVSQVVALNADRYVEEEGYEFLTFDPQINITGNFTNATYMKIWFSCRVIEWTVGYLRKDEEIYRLRNSNQQLVDQLQSLQNEMQTQAAYISDHRLKAASKVMLYGKLSRGKK